MYVKRVRITNYGPIEALDVEFPFDGDKPKPVVLVGANGSGKSVLLSNIVNGLLNTQATAYPESPEVELGKVYKVRSPQYVALGKEYSFTQVDFVDSPPLQELILPRLKRNFKQVPAGIAGTEAESLYDKLNSEGNTIFEHKIGQQKAQKLLQETCALYFPPNRFEDPAWLNSDNLAATAKYMDLKHLQGHSNRLIVNCSPLHRNQNWLFELIYDFSVFERQYEVLPVVMYRPQPTIVNVSTSVDIQGSARSLYNAATKVLRATLRSESELGLSIGPRQSRTVSVTVNREIRIPNIFQLSSGEILLLNLFLSILRDYDLTGVRFTSAEEICGIVIVDEIDLHLHALHQYEVLPRLMSIFPKVQFVVTSHSPLFVLGLKQILGEQGFDLYELPSGTPISAEDFEEFGEAYRAFCETHRHSEEVRIAIRKAQRSLIFVEGIIDVKYLCKAASLLGFKNLTEEVAEIREGGGSGYLDNIWKGWPEHHVERQNIVLLYDPECRKSEEEKGSMFRRLMTRFDDHPIEKGIENLFDRETLERARRECPAFIDVTNKHSKMVRGEEEVVPEVWTVNNDEKTNLCRWLCDNGTADNFEHFKPTLEMLNDILTVDKIEEAS